MVTIEQIAKRLEDLGYCNAWAITENHPDYAYIEFELNKTLNYAKNYCNITEIPEIVEPRIIDRVCSEFLFNKKNSGLLLGFNYDTVIKRIKEGDTTIDYAVGSGEDTPENRFDSLVKHLERGFDKWLTPHRRLRW